MVPTLMDPYVNGSLHEWSLMLMDPYINGALC